jgi:hypothetical protein
MTPSEAHDSARNRDAGHDEMQAEVWRWLNKQRATVSLTSDGPTREFTFAVANVEEPLYVKGRILAWVDVCARYESFISANHNSSIIYAFEIKPKIWSVGAVIRQCITIGSILERSGSIRSRVTAVVPHDDPKISLLIETYGDVLAWRDGAPA